MSDTVYLTPDEVAEMLRCRPEKIYRLCAEKKLPSIRFEGRRLIPKADLDEYLEKLRDAA